MKKNCNNCAHLEWAFGDISDPEGFVCNRRYWPSGREEDKMIARMDNEKYREKSKVCFANPPQAREGENER